MEPTATSRITEKAFEILEENPEGISWTELKKEIETSDPTLHPKTINGIVWKLTEKYPERVYKPSKGIFKLVKNKEK